MLAAAALVAATVPGQGPQAPFDDGPVFAVSCSAAYADDDGCEVQAAPFPIASAAGMPAGGEAQPPPPRLPRAQRPFGWAEGVMAACVTFVQGVTPRQALAVLVPDPDHGPGRPADVLRWAQERGVDGLAEAGTVGGWTFVWQDNRWSCASQETVESLRGARRFVSVFWNVNAVTHLVVAVRGRVLRDVDPVAGQVLIGRPRPSERGLDWVHWPSALLAVVERETGVRITDPDWPSRNAVVAAVEPL